MAKGAWSADDTINELVPANRYRDELYLESYSGDQCFLGFGEDPVVDEGMSVSSGGSITVTGAKAREAVYGICENTNSASGGWQD